MIIATEYMVLTMVQHTSVQDRYLSVIVFIGTWNQELV